MILSEYITQQYTYEHFEIIRHFYLLNRKQNVGNKVNVTQIDPSLKNHDLHALICTPEITPSFLSSVISVKL